MKSASQLNKYWNNAKLVSCSYGFLAFYCGEPFFFFSIAHFSERASVVGELGQCTSPGRVVPAPALNHYLH